MKRIINEKTQRCRYVLPIFKCEVFSSHSHSQRLRLERLSQTQNPSEGKCISRIG